MTLNRRQTQGLSPSDQRPFDCVGPEVSFFSPCGSARRVRQLTWRTRPARRPSIILFFLQSSNFPVLKPNRAPRRPSVLLNRHQEKNSSSRLPFLSSRLPCRESPASPYPHTLAFPSSSFLSSSLSQLSPPLVCSSLTRRLPVPSFFSPYSALKKLDINASFFPRAFPDENDEEQVENTSGPSTSTSKPPPGRREPSYIAPHAAEDSSAPSTQPGTRATSPAGVSSSAASLTSICGIWFELEARSRRGTQDSTQTADRTFVPLLPPSVYERDHPQGTEN